jgi:hypothetical protein
MASPVLKRYLSELDEYEGPAHPARQALAPAQPPSESEHGAASAGPS